MVSKICCPLHPDVEMRGTIDTDDETFTSYFFYQCPVCGTESPYRETPEASYEAAAEWLKLLKKRQVLYVAV